MHSSYCLYRELKNGKDEKKPSRRFLEGSGSSIEKNSKETGGSCEREQRPREAQWKEYKVKRKRENKSSKQ